MNVVSQKSSSQKANPLWMKLSLWLIPPLTWLALIFIFGVIAPATMEPMTSELSHSVEPIQQLADLQLSDTSMSDTSSTSAAGVELINHPEQAR